jgi:gramicidin S synthase 2/tyrocidine synthetase-3
MVPNVMLPLEALPRLPSGKIDRNALVTNCPKPVERQREFVAANSPLEKLVAGVWSGLHENFFELGGHSLSAMRVVARLIRRCQVEVSVRHVFEAPTVQLLSQELFALMEQHQVSVEGRPSIQ